MMLPTRVQLELPDWVRAAVDPGRVHAGDAGKVALAIELSRRNVDEGTGGPFGAALFGPDDRVVSVGVNRVLAQQCSLAHAENMAVMLAQQRLGSAPLDPAGGPYVLAASSQPCCQCYGATIWAGIDRLLIGARSEDVTALTEFDEGPLPADWIGELARRGIAVVRDLHREDACAVLRRYAASGGPRY